MPPDVGLRGVNGDGAPDVDAEETREWLDSLESVLQHDGADRARFLLDRAEAQGGHQRRRDPVHRQHAVHQHHPRQPSAGLSRQPRARAAHQEPGPLERDGDGRPRQQDRRHPRRPHRHLRLVGHAVRDRLQPLLPRPGPPRRRRHRLLPGPRLARHLRPRLPRRPADREAAGKLPPRAAAGRRPVVLSASLADAGLLAVPDGVDGPRPDHGDLPGALQPLPGTPRPEEAVQPARLVPSSATASATSPNRSAP